MRSVLIIKSTLLCMLSVTILPMPKIFSDAPAAEEADCSHNALRSYFPEKFVGATLKKLNVPEDKWQPIIEGLKNREADVENIVEANAEKLSPNPLKDPQQRQAAVKLFKDALFEVAGKVFRANGITDDAQINAILSDIQQQKVKQFSECIEKNKLPRLPPRPQEQEQQKAAAQ